VLFWSYVSFSQYLIIWSGNLPEETPFYAHRSRGGWQFVAWVIIGLHFALPFLLLLARQTKRTPGMLIGIASLLLVMRMIDLYWLIIPALHPERIVVHWLYVVVPVAMGGLWLAVFTWRLGAHAEVPVVDIPDEEDELDDVARQPAH
jgi:hypothetical protein